jgi:hypothetical protein
LAQIFPKWANWIPLIVLGGGGALALTALALLYYYGSPQNTQVGYRPPQPVHYSHRLHPGNLGLDCRYCHNQVESSRFANLPSVQTCMNCHKLILRESELLKPVRDAWENGQPIQWIRVHDLPDYAYFDHAAHLRGGVGCVTCHGEVVLMDTTIQIAPLSMGWCLDCHRNPEPNLRPTDQVVNMYWQPPENQHEWAADFRRKQNINPPTDCSGCHR